LLLQKHYKRKSVIQVSSNDLQMSTKRYTFRKRELSNIRIKLTSLSKVNYFVIMSSISEISLGAYEVSIK